MMKRLYLWATVLFWILVVGIWAVERRPGADSVDAARVATAPDAPASGGAPPQAEAAPVTLAEVARHATSTDCWMAIDGQVHDVTRYVPDHPADEEVLTAWCGREASEAYRTKLQGRRHSVRADRLLETLRIAPMDTRSPPVR